MVAGGEDERRLRSYIADFKKVVVKESHGIVAGRVLVVEVAAHQERVRLFTFDDLAKLIQKILVLFLPVVVEVEHLSDMPVRSVEYFH